MRPDAAYLHDIIAACGRIRSITETSADFSANEICTADILHHLTAIREAVSRLSKALHDQQPHVPGRQIAAVRNRIVHAYFDLDWEILRETALTDVPELQSQVEAILAQDTGNQ